MTSKPPDFRQSMPKTTAFIDACRAAFGRESIDASIKMGMRGMGMFYASENGIAVGTRLPRFAYSVSGDDLMLIDPELDVGVGRKRRRSI